MHDLTDDDRARLNEIAGEIEHLPIEFRRHFDQDGRDARYLRKLAQQSSGDQGLREQTAAEMLAEFHRLFAHPTTDALWLRPTLHREKHAELIDALEDAERLTGINALDEALPQVAREIADVVYVAYGTALLYGIDLDAALREVHRANLSKVGDDGRPIRRDDGKILKGPNFRPPDMAAALSDSPHDKQED